MIDAIGPFFIGYQRRKINWSKLPFENLATCEPQRSVQFGQIRADMQAFALRIAALGYNAATVDDVAHLVDHPWYEDHVRQNISVYIEEFSRLFSIMTSANLSVYVTMDVFSSTRELNRQLMQSSVEVDDFIAEQINRFLTLHPDVAGVVMRIGESDGLDVHDDFKSRLHVKTPQQLNKLLTKLLPVFERHGKRLILRTWTVGAYQIGDLIWHRDTFAKTLKGISSKALVLSMKHGESDFFRHLPLNRNFFRTNIPKIIELQTKREYEGCGEFPSFIGFDHERYARELDSAPNMLGISVWCQTGGWVPFRRTAFIGDGSIWTEINTQITLLLFRDRQSVEQAVKSLGSSGDDTTHLMELLRLSDEVIKELYYQEEFAQQKLFFRRVRIPPLIGVYWNTIFVNHSLRRVLKYIIQDPETCIRSGKQALVKIERMRELAVCLNLPEDDIIFMHDTLSILALAREYFYNPYNESIRKKLKKAKKRYKKQYPKGSRYRYAVQLDFRPFRVRRRFLNWSLALLLRRKRGYRLIDQLFTIHLLSLLYRWVSSRRTHWIPKFARKSAMGVDTIFK